MEYKKTYGVTTIVLTFIIIYSTFWMFLGVYIISSICQISLPKELLNVVVYSALVIIFFEIILFLFINLIKKSNECNPVRIEDNILSYEDNGKYYHLELNRVTSVVLDIGEVPSKNNTNNKEPHSLILYTDNDYELFYLKRPAISLIIRLKKLTKNKKWKILSLKENLLFMPIIMFAFGIVIPLFDLLFN